MITMPNKTLHLTAIRLRSIAAGELERYGPINFRMTINIL